MAQTDKKWGIYIKDFTFHTGHTGNNDILVRLYSLFQKPSVIVIFPVKGIMEV